MSDAATTTKTTPKKQQQQQQENHPVFFSRMLCEFSESHQLFALATADNRLRVYDVAQKRLRVECSDANHLTFRYTALSWGPQLPSTSLVPPAPSTPSSEKAKKRSKPSANNAASLINTCDVTVALGSNRGDITIFDTLSGEVVRRLVGPHKASIRGLCWSVAEGVLYSVDTEGIIGKWNAKEGTLITRWRCGKQATSIALLSADRLLAGHLAVRVLDTKSTTEATTTTTKATSPKELEKLEGGHSTPVSRMKCVDGRYLLTSATNDRHICLWDMTNSKAVMSQCFVSVAPPTYIDAVLLSDKLHVAVLAVNSDGCINIWMHTITAAATASSSSSDAMAGRQPDLKIGAGANRCASACFSRDGRHLETVRGAVTLLPRFDSVEYLLSDKCTVLTKLDLPPMTDTPTAATATEKKARKEKKTTPAAVVDVLAAHEAGSLTSMKVASTVTTMQDLARAQAVADKKDTPAATTTTTAKKPKEKKQETAAVATTATSKATTTKAASTSLPKADSLESALVQAIKTSDKQLLDGCLATRDPALIQNTVRRLAPQYVVSFLKSVVDQLQVLPGGSSRAMSLVFWVRAILTEHMSYLMTIPNIVGTLEGLYLVVHSRLETHKELLKLSGRVDLVLNQIAKASQHSNADDVAAIPINLITESDDGDLIYDEEDDESVEEEEEDEDDDEDEEGMEDVDEDSDAGDLLEGMDEVDTATDL